MEISILEKKEGDSMVLDVSGDIELGESSTRLRNSVRNSLNAGVSNITLDLADVNYLDSSGIGELISSLVAVSRADGRMVILNPTDQIRRLLEISQLTELFDIEYR